MQIPSARTIRLVVMPTEHGGWVFLAEPVLLGLLVAPSLAGLWIGLGAVLIFMVRQPMKLALADRLGGKRYPRTVLAERLALGFGLAAAVAVAVALLVTRFPFWLPVLLAAPIALLQTYFDVQRQSRQLAAELAGAVAIGASVAAITLAGGKALPLALALWAIVSLQSVAAVLYVRTRLRLERGEPVDRAPSWAAHLVALALSALLVYARLVPWLAMLAVGILGARALWGLSPWRRPSPARVIGTQELGYSALVVALIALGYALFSL